MGLWRAKLTFLALLTIIGTMSSSNAEANDSVCRIPVVAVRPITEKSTAEKLGKNAFGVLCDLHKRISTGEFEVSFERTDRIQKRGTYTTAYRANCAFDRVKQKARYELNGLISPLDGYPSGAKPNLEVGYTANRIKQLNERFSRTVIVSPDVTTIWDEKGSTARVLPRDTKIGGAVEKPFDPFIATMLTHPEIHFGSSDIPIEKLFEQAIQSGDISATEDSGHIHLVVRQSGEGFETERRIHLDGSQGFVPVKSELFSRLVEGAKVGEWKSQGRTETEWKEMNGVLAPVKIEAYAFPGDTIVSIRWQQINECIPAFGFDYKRLKTSKRILLQDDRKKN